MPNGPEQTAEEALRAALLDVLVEIAQQLVSTEKGRKQLADTYWQSAETAHPAVAEVFREAAERVR